MFEIKNLTLMVGANRPLIENLNLSLNPGDKIAIVGEEGNGKSTLLKAIKDENLVSDYCIIKGSITRNNLRIGLLEQLLDLKWNDIYIYNYFLKDKPNDEVDYEKYNNLKQIKETLAKLNLDPNILDSDRKINTLSGGEKVKIQIAKLMVSKPDILLLDEPTNDLDIETLEWLEKFINEQNVPIIYVSHDETLLERTANAILHLEQIKKKSAARYTLEKITYTEYVEQRQRKLTKQDQIAGNERMEYKKKKQELSHQKSAVRSAQINTKDSSARRVLNKKMKNIKALEKRLEEMPLTERPDVEEAIHIFFNNHASISNQRIILDLKLDELKIGNKALSRNIELIVKGLEKVVIIGKNGIGKTSLLKIIYQNLTSKEDLKVGYMPQNYEDMLDKETIAFNYLMNISYSMEESIVRTYMGNMKFTGEEMELPIKSLSGGQKAKLQLLGLILSDCNVIILDEPTRNLSPLSNPVIREALYNYQGTIISVSHDRKYVAEVATTIYELTEEGLKKYK
jgi:ATPase subunit of ABC transporter with duplicated ATPase domains